MEGSSNSGGGGIVYRETISYVKWLPMMIFAMIAVFGVVFASFLALGYYGSAAVFGVVTLFLVLLWLNFRHLVFLITTDKIEFGFGLIIRRFPRSDLVSCEPYELRFRNYLGYGIRIGFDGTIAYNTRNGRGVKMFFQGAKRPYVVPVDDPERVCALLS